MLKYNPTTHSRFDLRTGKVYKPKLRPRYWRAIDPNRSGKLYPLDPDTGVLLTQTNDSSPGLFDYKTGLPIDPETQKVVEVERFDAETGIPLDPVTKQPATRPQNLQGAFSPLTKIVSIHLRFGIAAPVQCRLSRTAGSKRLPK